MFTRARRLSLTWTQWIQPTVPMLARLMRPTPSHPTYSCYIHFNIILPSTTGFLTGFSSSGFPISSLYAFIFAPYVSCAPPISSSLIWSPWKWWEIRIIKLITLFFCSILFLCRYKAQIYLSSPYFRTRIAYALPLMEGPISTLVQDNGGVYLIFVLSYAKREDGRFWTDWQKASN